MLARLRISVPDRPGSLGRVASAIGSAGGDIAKLSVLESEAGRALDDVFVVVRDSDHLDRLTAALGQVAGVTVTGVQSPCPPVTGHTELELVQQVLAQPERALQTLVDGAPAALGADWAAIVRFDAHGVPGEVLAVSTNGPATDKIVLTSPLRLAPVPLQRPGTEEFYSGAALVPLVRIGLGLLLVRESGVDYHRSELWRLGPLGEIVGPLLTG